MRKQSKLETTHLVQSRMWWVSGETRTWNTTVGMWPNRADENPVLEAQARSWGKKPFLHAWDTWQKWSSIDTSDQDCSLGKFPAQPPDTLVAWESFLASLCLPVSSGVLGTMVGLASFPPHSGHMPGTCSGADEVAPAPPGPWCRLGEHMGVTCSPCTWCLVNTF